MEDMTKGIEAVEDVMETAAERKIDAKKLGIGGLILLGGIALTKWVIIPGIKKIGGVIKAKKAAKKTAEDTIDMQDMVVEDLPPIED